MQSLKTNEPKMKMWNLTTYDMCFWNVCNCEDIYYLSSNI